MNAQSRIHSRSQRLAIPACATLLALSAFAGLCVGPSGFPSFSALLSGEPSSQIFLHIRLPRVLLAAQIGASLSAGGLIMQTLLRNELADPYILGVSGGAAVGTVGSLLLNLAFSTRHIAAFLGGMASLIFLALRIKRPPTEMLLSGVMLNAMCGALILFLSSLLSGPSLGAMFGWYLGDLGAGTLSQALILLVVSLPFFLALCLCGHMLNLFLLGNESANSLGLNTQKTSLLLLAAVTFLTSLSVSTAGPIGFVGLVVPHILRLAMGNDHRLLLPACLLSGASFLILCDTLSRILPSQGELPVGVLTALLGAPTFILLLHKRREGMPSP